LGEPFYERIDAAATQEQKKILSTASAEQIGVDELAGGSRDGDTDENAGFRTSDWRPQGDHEERMFARGLPAPRRYINLRREFCEHGSSTPDSGGGAGAIAQLFKQDTPV